MKPSEQEQWLRSVIASISRRNVDNIGADEDLQEAAGLDSLGRLEVLAEVEDKYDFFFDDDVIGTSTTLNQIESAIDRQLQRDARAAN